MNMRNLQRSGSQKREKRKMVRSVLTPGKLCSFGSESPKPFEFKRGEQLEVKSQREIAAIQGWLVPIPFPVLPTEYIFLTKVITENLCLCLPILWGGRGTISPWTQGDLRV